eukprot:701518-Prorocentrum_minimum.AAC.1
MAEGDFEVAVQLYTDALIPALPSADQKVPPLRQPPPLPCTDEKVPLSSTPPLPRTDKKVSLTSTTPLPPLCRAPMR